MASYGYTFTSGDTVTPSKLNNARTVSDIVNADIKSDAAIAHSKLANIPSGQLLLGNGSNVPTATAVTGDVTISNTGVTAITAGSIVTADLGDGAVTSAKISDGTIVNADINASAAIAGTKIAPDFGSQNIATTGTISSGAITAPTLTLNTGSTPLLISNASEPYVEVRDTTATTRAFIQASNGIGGIGTISNHPFQINTNNAERIRIDASGNVGIGTASPSTKLQVAGAVTATTFAGNLTGTASAIADGCVTAAKLNGAQTGSAPIYGCRAWVRFSGTGTPSIAGSGNIASVTRNGSSAVGLYNVTFTTAMPSDAYSVVVSAVNAGSAGIAWADSFTTTGFRVACFNTSNAFVDCSPISVAVFV